MAVGVLLFFQNTISDSWNQSHEFGCFRRIWKQIKPSLLYISVATWINAHIERPPKILRVQASPSKCRQVTACLENMTLHMEIISANCSPTHYVCKATPLNIMERRVMVSLPYDAHHFCASQKRVVLIYTLICWKVLMYVFQWDVSDLILTEGALTTFSENIACRQPVITSGEWKDVFKTKSGNNMRIEVLGTRKAGGCSTQQGLLCSARGGNALSDSCQPMPTWPIHLFLLSKWPPGIYQKAVRRLLNFSCPDPCLDLHSFDETM